MANLKAGTLIGGNLIWNAGNLPLRTSAKNLYIEDAQVYTTAFKPTPADVNAVAKTGDTMTGTLITKQIKVTDQYALTTNSGGNTQGIFLGFSGSDRRTIVGGGDASAGTVVMRPRGIGDANANTVFNTNGTINASVDGTSSSHLVRKGQMDTADNLRLLKEGDTMTGRLVLNYTSSMRVPVGTNDQRGSSETGSFRFNTTETSFEGYDGAEWQPIGSGRVKFTQVTANTTAKKGKGYLVDTTKSGIVVTLPADANDGDFVVIGDGSGNANKNVFYVAGYNGDRIIIDRDNCMLRFSKFGTKWVISDGVGETGALDTENYIKKAGDTINGDLKFASGKKIRLATSDWASGAEIYSRPAGDGYGANVYVYAGGNLVLGSGESSRNLESLTTGENFYLTSDGDMRFIVGSNTWTDRNQMTLSSSGRLDVPAGTTIRGGSNHVSLVETDQSDKTWHIEVQNKNLSIVETGVATRLTLSEGGNATVSGRISASGYSTSTAGNAYTTGKTSDGSYAAVSAESGHVMLWKRNDSTTIADEFIGINKSELIFRQDNKTGDKKYTDCKVYHTKNKPTASDVGAMPISGGAFTDSISLANKAASMTVADDATIRYLYGNSTWFHTYVDKVNGEFTVGSGASGENKLMTINYSGVVGTSGQGVLYGTLNKPTAADVGLGNVPNTTHTTAATANTVSVRDGSGDIHARLFRSSYGDESGISGGLAFRKSTTDNYIRFCNNTTNIRNWLGAQGKSDIRSNSMNNTQTTIPATESGDMNAQIAGYYGLYNGTKVANSPYSGYFYCETKSIYADGALLQTAWPYDGYGGTYHRNYSLNTKSWTPWITVHSTLTNKVVQMTDIFTAKNGWIVNNDEWVVNETPTHYYCQGIFRHSSGVAHVGDFNRTVKFSYMPCTLSNGATVAYIERVPRGTTVSCNHAVGVGWIMVTMVVQKL